MITIQHECMVGHCTNLAEYEVKNTGTGAIWVMCAWHKANYTRGNTMVASKRLETN